MPELSADQFSLIYNMLSLTIAAMFGTFAFFVLAKENIAVKYKPAIVCSSLVVPSQAITTSEFSKVGRRICDK